MAVAGSAVGLGNFLRFPGLVADKETGGGAFLIAYFISLLIVGLPICWVEWTLGRFGGTQGYNSSPGIFHAIIRKPWGKYVGLLGFIIPVGVYFYYVVIESWCLGYAWNSFSGSLDLGKDSKVYADAFAAFTGENIVMNRNGIIAVVDEKNREKERYQVVYGAKIKFLDGQAIGAGDVMVEWDPYSFSILTEISGKVHFKDIDEGITVQEQVDEVSGLSQLVIIDSLDGKKVPTIIIRPEGGTKHDEKRYLMPTHAHIMVRDGDTVHAADVLAKIPRATSKTKDITGGLPRVVELFEARKPRDPAQIAEINGVVRFGEITKTSRKIYVTGDDGQEREYAIPRGAHINVQEGERVEAGDQLMDGPIDPHDILKVRGEKELQKYLVNEVQEVYRLQGVNINDKHLEVIVRQMLRWLKVEDIGDTDFLPEEVVDRFKFKEENEKTNDKGGRRSHARPILLGITKASLSTDSFISAASFQETTRVLTEAAINSKRDGLRGLKENVIMGRLIPAGTGMDYYRGVRIAGEGVPEEEPQPEVEISFNDSMSDYEDTARTFYAGGLSETEGAPDETIVE
jgi:DNA-directed RNA polymerase subunit beta'